MADKAREALSFFTRERRARYEWRWAAIALTLLSVHAFFMAFLPDMFYARQYLSWGIIIAAFWRVVMVRPDDREQWPYYVFFFGLLAFYLINVIAAEVGTKPPGMGETDTRFIHLPGLTMAAAIGYGVRGKKWAQRYLTVLTSVFLCYYLTQAATLTWDSAFLDGRLILSRVYHTKLAKELLIIFSLLLAVAAAADKPGVRVYNLLGAAMLVFFIFLTKTRSVLLVMFFVTAPAVCLTQPRFGAWKQKVVAGALIFFIAAPALSAIWYLNAGPDRRSPLSARSRMKAWGIAWEIVEKADWTQKMIGHGRFHHSFSALAIHYHATPPETNGEVFKHAHNVAMQTLVETGALGLLALAMIWAAAFYRAARAWIRNKDPDSTVNAAALTALASVAAICQLDYCLDGVPGMLYWTVIGLAFASGSDDVPLQGTRNDAP